MRIIDLESNEVARAHDLYKSIQFDVAMCDNIKDAANHMGCKQKDIKVDHKRYIVIDDDARKACVCTV